MREDTAYGTIAIYTNDPRGPLFLIVRHVAGHVGFPKGHREEGEIPLQTALRECAEETGVMIEECAILHDAPLEETYRIPKENVTHHKEYGEDILKKVFYFIGEVNDMTTDTSHARDEIAECLWLPYEEAKKAITFKESRDVLMNAHRIITTHIHDRH